MARADLVKKLFKSFKRHDSDAFLDVAWEIVEEERKKRHTVVANELARILGNGSSQEKYDYRPDFKPLPKDKERGIPLLDVRQPDRYLSDLVLSKTQEAVVDEIMREFVHWDVLRANGLVPSHKLLFCGPPGCGKTATAEAIACEIGLPLLYVRFDSVVSSLLGETASNLRKVFDYAADDSWVILFDEFDAVGRSRDDPTEHGELRRVVNAFLQMLDSFAGKSLVIAATNFEQSLDPAIWRRFDDIVRFEKPDEDQILRLLEKILSSKPTQGFELAKLVQELEGLSFAEVERVCIDALKQSALDGRRHVSQADIRKAFSKLHRRKNALSASKSSNGPSIDEE